MRKALTPVLESFRGMTILDVGCGVGRWTRVMSRQNSVIGVDISRFMARMAKDSCQDRNCSFVVADISLLPFKEGAFDLVVSITVLQHIVSSGRFLQAVSEIARCSNSEALVAEEMWSDRETVFNVYCPTRILPVESYLEGMSVSGLCPYCLHGISFAPTTICLTRLFRAVQSKSEGTFRFKLRASRIISWFVHFAMGVGILSAIFTSSKQNNPKLSLHTIIYAKKCAQSHLG